MKGTLPYHERDATAYPLQKGKHLCNKRLFCLIYVYLIYIV